MGIFIALIISIVCALICGGIAAEKGRSGLAWAFIGFFFTWVGVLVIAVLGDENSTQVVYKEKEIIREMPVVKERASKNLINKSYDPSVACQITEVKLIEEANGFVAVLSLKNYGQALKVLKTALIIEDSLGEEVVLQNIIFDMRPMHDQWQSSEPFMLMPQEQLALKHLVSVTVQPKVMVWEDETKLNFEGPWLIEKDLNSIVEAKKVYGDDAIRTYVAAENGAGFTCACGLVNGFDTKVCKRCGREASMLAGGDGSQGFIDELRQCHTIAEAAEVLNSYKSLLKADKVQVVQTLVDRDLYIKRMYGSKNDDEKIQKYIDTVMND